MTQPMSGGYYPSQFQQQWSDQQNAWHHMPSNQQHGENGFTFSSMPKATHYTSESAAEPAPKSWKEGAEKVKKGFSGFFDVIGKTFKRLFSKEGLSPLAGFFGRTAVGAGAEIAKQFVQIFIPAFADKNQRLYASTFSVAISEIAELFKSVIPVDNPLNDEFSDLFHNVSTVFTKEVSDHQKKGHQKQTQRKEQDIAERLADVERREAALKQREQQHSFAPSYDV